MQQALKPAILLCDVDSLALVKAAQQGQKCEFIIKRYQLREPGEEEFCLFHVRTQMEMVFRDVMSCLIEAQAICG